MLRVQEGLFEILFSKWSYCYIFRALQQNFVFHTYKGTTGKHMICMRATSQNSKLCMYALSECKLWFLYGIGIRDGDDNEGYIIE